MTISRVVDGLGERCGHALLILLLAAAAFHADRAGAEDLKPKFGPHATPIVQSHQYLRTHRAPDYWALSPYYVPQVTRASCSLATVATLLNALRGLPAHSEERLISQESLLTPTAASKSPDPEWVEKAKEWSGKVSEAGSGVTFSEFRQYVVASLKAYGLDAEVIVFKPTDRSKGALNQLRQLLAANERSASDIALIYYNQGVVTGDWDGPHLSPIGAYDRGHRRVLIMDVDRQWYVPYWTSDERLLEALVRPAPAGQGSLAGQTGGVIWVKLRH
jgi:hypothetical protein